VTINYALANRLPDPDYARGYWGAGSPVVAVPGDAAAPSTADAGPGWATVQLQSDEKYLVNRTNSQRVIARAVAGQKWLISIKYNPMTYEEFAPVYGFLAQQRGPLTPFYVSLPQYRNPINSGWASLISETVTPSGGALSYKYNFSVLADISAGSSKVIVHVNAATGESTAAYNNNSGQTHAGMVPKPGDMININDTNDTNHDKAYLITMVETAGAKEDSATNLGTNGDKMQLTVTPPFVRPISITGSGASVVFKNPLVKVIAPKGLGSYSLNTDNLYSYSLKLEEHL